MRNVIAPKLIGACKLSQAVFACPIKEWAHYSSLSAILGTPSQANYACANAGLNRWATLQQCSGTSVMDMKRDILLLCKTTRVCTDDILMINQECHVNQPSILA
jgi:hypothetical protein